MPADSLSTRASWQIAQAGHLQATNVRGEQLALVRGGCGGCNPLAPLQRGLCAGSTAQQCDGAGASKHPWNPPAHHAAIAARLLSQPVVGTQLQGRAGAGSSAGSVGAGRSRSAGLITQLPPGIVQRGKPVMASAKSAWCCCCSGRMWGRARMLPGPADMPAAAHGDARHVAARDMRATCLFAVAREAAREPTAAHQEEAAVDKARVAQLLSVPAILARSAGCDGVVGGGGGRVRVCVGWELQYGCREGGLNGSTCHRSSLSCH